MSPTFLISLLLLAVLTLLFVSAEEDVVIRKGKKPPSQISAALTPSLQCSACEIVVREVFQRYKKRSVHDKFYGTDVEVADILGTACDGLGGKYALRQESFGARLKVFGDNSFKYDIQNTEPPQFYHEYDERRYANSPNRLQRFCETFVEKFYESHLRRHVVERTDEPWIKQDMCYINATKLCDVETLKPYREVEERKRRRWKKEQRQQQGHQENVASDLTEKHIRQQEEQMENMQRDFVDVASTEDL